MKKLLTSLALLLTLTSCALAQAAQPAPAVEFNYQDAEIPMRDGVKLHTVIATPKVQTAPLPFLMTRTPYGVATAATRRGQPANRELVADGYIFVFQDIRGKNLSEGEFFMNRPPRDKKDPKSVDESSDTYDAIEWLIKNIPNNNGRVGIYGVSYPGWLAAVPLLEPHPALKALSPQAMMGDDFFHQGGFRLAYGYEYVYGVENKKEGDDPTFELYDTYEWYLKKGALSNFFSPRLPTWKAFIEHPSFDAYWQARSAVMYLKEVTVPTLHVAGWFDQEDFYGPMKAYQALEKNDKNHMNFITVGPWNHGGWRNGAGDRLGNIQFQQATAQHFREKIEAPFFAYHLHGKGDGKFPEAQMFETGSNQWKTYDQWPPVSKTTERKLYFHPHGKLSFEAPQETGANSSAKAFDTYVSDPQAPVPYRRRPIEPTYFSKGSGWRTWLMEDQRFVTNRPDVLTFETDVLTEDVTISGEITAQLFAATTGSDSDWVVKLIDVLPEEIESTPQMGGYQFMVTGEVMRGRYYRGFDKPQALKPNAINEFNVYLIHKDHSFKKGHKIMVQVQSTWFPVIDRNPQKYVENIFKAQDADYIAATQTIFRSKQFASGLKLPVVTK